MMKLIVDKMPEVPEKCLFLQVKNGKSICVFEEHSPISDCYNPNNCPYLIPFDNYLDKRIDQYYGKKRHIKSAAYCPDERGE